MLKLTIKALEFSVTHTELARYYRHDWEDRGYDMLANADTEIESEGYPEEDFEIDIESGPFGVSIYGSRVVTATESRGDIIPLEDAVHEALVHSYEDLLQRTEIDFPACSFKKQYTGDDDVVHAHYRSDGSAPVSIAEYERQIAEQHEQLRAKDEQLQAYDAEIASLKERIVWMNESSQHLTYSVDADDSAINDVVSEPGHTGRRGNWRVWRTGDGGVIFGTRIMGSWKESIPARLNLMGG